MKKRVLIVLGILIAAGGIGTGVWYHFGSGSGGSDDTVVYVSKVSVLTGVESAATNRFAGVVEPQETVNVKIEDTPNTIAMINDSIDAILSFFIRLLLASTFILSGHEYQIL